MAVDDTLDRYIPVTITATSNCKEARVIYCGDLQCVRNNGKGRCSYPLITIHGEQQACSGARVTGVKK